MMTMVMWETYIIKGRLADGKFDCFSTVSHQLDHMVSRRPGHDHIDNQDDIIRSSDWPYLWSGYIKIFKILLIYDDWDGDKDGDDDDDNDHDHVADKDDHLATSSPLMERIWSPGMSLSTLGPPPVTNLKKVSVGDRYCGGTLLCLFLCWFVTETEISNIESP